MYREMRSCDEEEEEKGMKGDKGGIYQEEVERVKEEGNCAGMERRNYGEEEERLRMMVGKGGMKMR